MLTVRFFKRCRKAKVDDFDLTVIIGKDYIPGFQITMDVAFAVNAANTGQKLLEEASRGFLS